MPATVSEEKHLAIKGSLKEQIGVYLDGSKELKMVESRGFDTSQYKGQLTDFIERVYKNIPKERYDDEEFVDAFLKDREIVGEIINDFKKLLENYGDISQDKDGRLSQGAERLRYDLAGIIGSVAFHPSVAGSSLFKEILREATGIALSYAEGISMDGLLDHEDIVNDYNQYLKENPFVGTPIQGSPFEQFTPTKSIVDYFFTMNAYVLQKNIVNFELREKGVIIEDYYSVTKDGVLVSFSARYADFVRKNPEKFPGLSPEWINEPDKIADWLDKVEVGYGEGKLHPHHWLGVMFGYSPEDMAKTNLLDVFTESMIMTHTMQRKELVLYTLTSG